MNPPTKKEFYLKLYETEGHNCDFCPVAKNLEKQMKYFPDQELPSNFSGCLCDFVKHYIEHELEDVEVLAKDLHESGREAVLTNKVVKKDGSPVGQIHFKEWDELTEDAKEGRRIQARYLLKNYSLVKK